jgi:general secretion pathway protein L
VLPAHSGNISSGSLDEALNAARAAKGKALILIVPAADIVLSTVTLPIRQQSKLLQAVPYALEEQLAEDVEKLHFAIGEKQSDGSVPVASVARDSFMHWLKPLQDAGLEITAVFPETLCLPSVAADSGWQILIDGSDCVIRSASYSGFCCDVSELGDFLAMALSDADLPEGLRLRIYKTPGSTFSGLPGLPVHAEVVDIKAGLACLMGNANTNASARNINLLQGSYATQPAYERWWRPVRATAILFVCWIVIGTAYDAIQHVQLSQQLDALETENIARFRQLFPKVTRIVDMRAQGEQQLSQLRQDGAGAGLFAMLGATAEAVSRIDGLLVQEIQLRDGLLYMSLSASDIQGLENLRAHFNSAKGWKLDVQSANASTDGVQIRASLGAAL